MANLNNAIRRTPEIEPELLQTPPPRRLFVYRGEGFDPWESVRLYASLLAMSVLSFPVGAAIARVPYIDVIGFAVATFGGLTLLFTFPMALGNAIDVLKNIWLIRYGQATLATVITRVDTSDGLGGYHHVTYRFFTNNSDEINHTWTAEEPFWECLAGDFFTVIYAPRKPRSHVIYSCSLFQVSHHSDTA